MQSWQRRHNSPHTVFSATFVCRLCIAAGTQSLRPAVDSWNSRYLRALVYFLKACPGDLSGKKIRDLFGRQCVIAANREIAFLDHEWMRGPEFGNEFFDEFEFFPMSGSFQVR